MTEQERLTPDRLAELRQRREVPPMADERERCPLCGTPWTLEGGQVHMLGGLYCVRSQLTQAKAMIEQLKDALRAALEWIDAVPKDVALPAMPGFDRDWAESLVHDVKGAARMSDGTERWRAVRKRNPKIIAYEYAAQVIDTAIDGGIVLEGLDERELAKVEEALADIAASLERRAKRMRERPGGATDGR